jgi:hypothetical protein
MGWRRLAATSVKRSPHNECGYGEQGWCEGPGDCPWRSNENRPPTCGPVPVKYIFKFSNSTETCKFKNEFFPCSKNIQTLHAKDLNILNNFLNWADFKISTEFI